MPADSILASELRTLHGKLSAAQRERLVRPERPSPPRDRTAEAGAASAAPAGESAEERDLRDQIRDFVNEINWFLEHAESNIAAHPAGSVIGAMLIGILIGNALARR
jgi:hypothetical protein